MDQIQSLSDDALRVELSKFVTDVPPVIGSTRQLLEMKLLSFLSGDSPHVQPEVEPLYFAEVLEDVQVMSVPGPEHTVQHENGTDSENNGNWVSSFQEIDDSMDMDAVVRPKKRTKAQSVAAVSSETEISQTTALTSPPPSIKRVSDDVLNSAMKNYPGGMPSYHREPLHPNDMDISNPYVDYPMTRSPISESLIQKRTVTNLQSKTNGNSRNQTNFESSRVQSKSLSFSKPLLGVVLLAVVGLLGYLFVHWDPFYRNPIKS